MRIIGPLRREPFDGKRTHSGGAVLIGGIEQIEFC